MRRAANDLELLLLQLFRRTGVDEPPTTTVTTTTTMSGGVRSQKCDNQQVKWPRRKGRSALAQIRGGGECLHGINEKLQG